MVVGVITPDDVQVAVIDDEVVVSVRSRGVYGYGSTFDAALVELRREWSGWGEELGELDAALNPPLLPTTVAST